MCKESLTKKKPEIEEQEYVLTKQSPADVPTLGKLIFNKQLQYILADISKQDH